MKLHYLLPVFVAFSLSVLADDEKKSAADNTKRNQNDEKASHKTAGDQSNDPADVKITQVIRRAVVDEKGLSVNAKNIKIITNGGQVTLRGPVASAEEKTKVEKIAREHAGEGAVTSQIEVQQAK